MSHARKTTNPAVSCREGRLENIGNANAHDYKPTEAGREWFAAGCKPDLELPLLEVPGDEDFEDLEDDDFDDDRDQEVPAVAPLQVDQGDQP